MISASWQNVHSQEQSAQRMSSKYEAQGEIEKIIARLETAMQYSTMTDVVLADPEDPQTILALDPDDPSLLYVTVRRSEVQITCTLVLNGSITDPDTDGDYDIFNLTGVTCRDLDISTLKEAADESEPE